MKQRIIGKTLAVAVILLFIGVGISQALAYSKPIKTINSEKTLYVGGSDPGNYKKIQDAIDNASTGDTVFVYSGTYNEYLKIKKRINVIGEDRYNTFIKYDKTNHIVKITSNGVYFKNFTVEHYDFCGKYGIWVKSSNITVDKNIVLNNSRGIYVEGDGNFIENNHVSLNNAGIMINGNNNIICGNNITYNYYFGVDVFLLTEYNIIINNKICSNGYPYYGIGISVGTSKHTFIIGNTITNHPHDGDSGIPIELERGTFNYIYHNNIYDNQNRVSSWEYNKWYKDRRSGGNYWGKYKGFDVLPPFGIGDTPFIIWGWIRDKYPLMEPYENDPVSVFIYQPIRYFVNPYGYYWFFIHFFTVIIWGSKIEAYASDYEHDIEKVEFYIDNKLMATDYTRPYTWWWINRPMFFHKLKVVAYNTIGETGRDEIYVLMIPDDEMWKIEY